MSREYLSPERLSILKEFRAFGAWCHEVRETVDELASRLPLLDPAQGYLSDQAGEFDIAHLQGSETAYRLRFIAALIDNATPTRAEKKE
jgi:hypothetical protein